MKEELHLSPSGVAAVPKGDAPQSVLRPQGGAFKPTGCFARRVVSLPPRRGARTLKRADKCVRVFKFGGVKYRQCYVSRGPKMAHWCKRARSPVINGYEENCHAKEKNFIGSC